MNRRQFLCGLSAASVTALGAHQWLPLANASSQDTDATRLEGFIVSDAHFGWRNEQQPSPDEQRHAMTHILEKFPALDIVIDTGDAHHGDLRDADGDEARRHWLDSIANGAGTLPFLYVPGNHEIIGSAEGDHEDRCCRLGSLSCRPYYSFDMKGIHFVSVPEMIRAVYVTRETLEWLALDLNVHRDKTTILLSHNNITGTTGPYEAGYREVVNSDALMALFKRHPQVIAWMHGHNHNYQIVRRDAMLYVSNGRIGGFDPSRHAAEGSHGLGGIYFAITGNSLTVRSYSATRRCFLDELAIDAVSASIETGTSLAPDAPAAYSYGYGGARDGQRIPVHHHTVGKDMTRTLFMTGTPDAVFNDDPGMTLYTARHVDNPKRPVQQMLMGCDVRGPKTTWRWENPGIEIEPTGKSGKIQFVVPKGGDGQISCLRCAPGRAYLFRLNIDAPKGGGTLLLRGIMTDTTQATLHEAVERTHELLQGTQTVEYRMDIPDAAEHQNLYTDLTKDIETQLFVNVDITGVAAPIRILSAQVLFDTAEAKTKNPGIRLNNEPYQSEGTYSPDDIVHTSLPAKMDNREVVECLAGGNHRMTWLIREERVAWQVRNARARMKDGWLEVGPMRTTWMTPPVIMIAAATKPEHPYVYRLEGVASARVRYDNSAGFTVEICDMEFNPGATIRLASALAPASVEGGEVREIADGHMTITVQSRNMRIVFGTVRAS